jgi:hypothetical protein
MPGEPRVSIPRHHVPGLDTSILDQVLEVCCCAIGVLDAQETGTPSSCASCSGRAGEHGQQPRIDAAVYRGDIRDVSLTGLAQRLNQIGNRCDTGDPQIATLLLPERVIWLETYDLDSSSERPLGRSCWRTLRACTRPSQRNWRHRDFTSLPANPPMNHWGIETSPASRSRRPRNPHPARPRPWRGLLGRWSAASRPLYTRGPSGAAMRVANAATSRVQNRAIGAQARTTGTVAAPIVFGRSLTAGVTRKPLTLCDNDRAIFGACLRPQKPGAGVERCRRWPRRRSRPVSSPLAGPSCRASSW